MNQEIEHQMLVLWVELSNAVKKYAVVQKIPYLSVEPWNCDSTEVKRVWAAITNPNHLAYLAESMTVLQSRVIEPPHLTIHEHQIKQTQAALEDCKNRQS
jgi:hypothetical protein